MEGNEIVSAELLLSMMKENAILTALAVIALQGRKEDDISQNRAYEIYGQSWLEDREQRGLIKVKTRQGAGKTSPIMYSVFEIESLKRSEKLLQDEYQRLAERARLLIADERKRIAQCKK